MKNLSDSNVDTFFFFFSLLGADNEIGEKGKRLLRESLKKNTSLTKLDLRGDSDNRTITENII